MWVERMCLYTCMSNFISLIQTSLQKPVIGTRADTHTPSIGMVHRDGVHYTVCVGMKWVFLILLGLLSMPRANMVAAEASCPQVCSCRSSVVDCSHRGLTITSLPEAFPTGTTELRLHNNHLTALPSGLLDNMKALKLVTLHENPWECDCAVLYLRGWLLKQGSDGLIRNVSCSSPPNLRGRLVVYLSEEEVLSSCRYWTCDLALASQISLFVFIVVQALLLAALIHFLRRFDRLTSDARRAAAENFTPEDQGVSEGNEYVVLKDRSS